MSVVSACSAMSEVKLSKNVWGVERPDESPLNLSIVKLISVGVGVAMMLTDVALHVFAVWFKCDEVHVLDRVSIWTWLHKPMPPGTLLHR